MKSSFAINHLTILVAALWLNVFDTELEQLLSSMVKVWNKITYQEIMNRSDSVLLQSPYTNRNLQKAKWQHKNATKTFDYTTIADPLRTVSCDNDSHPTGIVELAYGIVAFSLTTKAGWSKGHSPFSSTVSLLTTFKDARIIFFVVNP